LVHSLKCELEETKIALQSLDQFKKDYQSLKETCILQENAMINLRYQFLEYQNQTKNMIDDLKSQMKTDTDQTNEKI
jgi:hypothetical protein